MTAEPVDLKALIIEDSHDDCQFLIHYLKKHGFNLQHKRVETEVDMKAALQSDTWDVILSDFSLPQFSGPRAFEVLKDSLLDIPFIIISGTVGEDIAVEMMRAGVSDYILKSNMHRLEPAIHRELLGLKSRQRHRETERTLHDTEEQLRQSQKMEAIGQLAGGIAHDFNNMLSVLQIYCHKVKETSGVSNDVKNYIDKILNVQARSAALTRQLLVFSRRQPCTLHPLDLNKSIESIQDMIESLVGSQIKVKIELTPSIQNILANESQIEQVIMNLSVNARDSMPKGGTLHIKTSHTTFKTDVMQGSAHLSKGHYAILEVSDTGQGIDPENLKKIFEPFFTTKPVGSGTGLGLSIIYGIVHQHNGSIEVTSVVNKGTSFKIYLPIVEGSLKVETQNKEKKQTPTDNQCILLVEDEAELRSLISEILVHRGFKVIEAKDGDEALEKIKNTGNKISLILTDMMMPATDGTQLAREVKKLGQEVPFLYMSGYFKHPMPAGFSFIEKPFTNEALLSKILQILSAK